MNGHDEDLERMLSTELGRRGDAVSGQGPSLDDVRDRARSIRRRRVAGTTLAAAAAVAAIAIPVGVLGGSFDRADYIPPANSPTPTGTATATEQQTPSEEPTASDSTPPSQSESADPGVECSAAGVPAPTPAADLPAEVRATAQQIIDAAMACDFEALESAGSEMTTNVGSDGVEMFAEWEQRGEGRLGTLLQVLATSHSAGGAGGSGVIYTWPAASGRSWSEVTPEQVEELRQIDQGSPMTFDELVESWEQLDAYHGWRLGIREDGIWLYFTGGD